MKIEYASSTLPIVNIGGANINGVYGPWSSKEEALQALTEIHAKHDLVSGDATSSDIPIGSTVGVYKDSNNKDIIEYWYINDSLVEKIPQTRSYGLIITDAYGMPVEKLQIKDGVYPSEINVKTIDLSTGAEVILGLLKYSVDGNSLKEFESPLDLTDLNIKKSFAIYWVNTGTVIAYKELPLSSMAYIKQDFYLSYTSENLPETYYYIPNDIEKDFYQDDAWTPHRDSAADVEWKAYPTGILKEQPYEFRISRERIDGHWGAASGPSISAKWGIDGVSTYDREAIYTLNDSYD